MSRLLAYHGPAISFSDALLVHPHSLIEQAYAPVEMVTGRVNADGFGLGWYAEGEALPGTYHHLTPIWSDMDLPRFGRVVRSSRIFAALRNATPGFHLDLQSIAPFTIGQYLFMHNGALQGFARRFRHQLRAMVPEAIRATIRGPTDAETIFALIRSELVEEELLESERASALMKEAMGSAIEAVMKIAREKQLQASINMGMTDGQAMVFCRLARGIAANSLYAAVREGGVWIVSERLDDGKDWEQVPEDSWVIVEPDSSLSIAPIMGLPDPGEWP